MVETTIIILTKNAGKGFKKTLGGIFSQKYDGVFEVLMIDSGSTDETLGIAEKYRITLIKIKPEEFNHGKTRNLGVENANGKYMVFITQDAIPKDDHWLENLINNLKDDKIAGVYGRQIAKDDATPMEKFFLSQQYPPLKIIRSLNNMGKGVDNRGLQHGGAIFSNANSAIKKEYLEKYKFPEDLVFGEDQVWCKKVLSARYNIVYDPSAAVYHSHNYSLKTTFQRFFDLGSVLWILHDKRSYGLLDFIRDGLRYEIKELKFLLKEGHVVWIPCAIIYDILKFMGVFLGKKEKYLPVFIKRNFSAHKSYEK